MGSLPLIIEILALLVDIAILVVLIIEFNYDKIQVERERAKKQRIRKPKEIIPPYEKEMD